MNTIQNSRFPTTSFHHVALKVKDFNRSLKFYTDVLGMNVALAWDEKPTRACMLDIGDGTYLELFEGGIADVELQPEPIIHFALQTDECDNMYHAAIGAGCRNNLEPKDLVINGKEKDLPIRISFVVGFDGELIEFFQYR